MASDNGVKMDILASSIILILLLSVFIDISEAIGAALGVFLILFSVAILFSFLRQFYRKKNRGHSQLRWSGFLLGLVGLIYAAVFFLGYFFTINNPVAGISYLQYFTDPVHFRHGLTMWELFTDFDRFAGNIRYAVFYALLISGYALIWGPKFAKGTPKSEDHLESETEHRPKSETKKRPKSETESRSHEDGSKGVLQQRAFLKNILLSISILSAVAVFWILGSSLNWGYSWHYLDGRNTLFFGFYDEEFVCYFFSFLLTGVCSAAIYLPISGSFKATSEERFVGKIYVVLGASILSVMTLTSYISAQLLFHQETMIYLINSLLQLVFSIGLIIRFQNRYAIPEETYLTPPTKYLHGFLLIFCGILAVIVYFFVKRSVHMNIFAAQFITYIPLLLFTGFLSLTFYKLGIYLDSDSWRKSEGIK